MLNHDDTVLQVKKNKEQQQTNDLVVNENNAKVATATDNSTTTTNVSNNNTKTTNTNNNTNNLTKKALYGTIATILLRLVSFICTQYTYRKINDPTILGSTNIIFELLLSTILFLSREGFRLTLLSSSSSSNSSDSTSNSSNSTYNSSNTANSNSTVKSNNNITNENISNNTWNIVSWCTIPITTLFSLLALLWHYYQCTFLESTAYDYQIGGILYCIAACIEGYGEPAVLIALRDMNMTIKASSEGLAVVIKTISIPILLSYLASSTASQSSLSSSSSSSQHNYNYYYYPICSFGIAQILYSIVYTSFLYWSVRHKITVPKLWSQKSTKSATSKSKSSSSTTILLIDYIMLYNYIKTIVLFTIQGLFKHMLTEGDRIVLTILAKSYDQGVYAMGSSYGGLAARMLLQPLEENARLLWSRTIATTTSQVNTSTIPSSTTTTNPEKDVCDSQKQQEIQQQDDKNDNTNNTMLRTSYIVLVKLVLYIGCIFTCIAVNYTRIVLVVLAGTKWGTNQQAATVLSGFCIYTSFLAWNGMTEAFIYAIIASSTTTSTSTKSSTESSSNSTDTTNSKNNHNNNQSITKDVSEVSAVLVVIGCIFTIIAFILVGYYGTIGLVAANCIAMFIRAMYAVVFAARYFVRQNNNNSNEKQQQQKVDTTTTRSNVYIVFIQLLHDMIPKPIVLVSFVLTYIVTRISLQYMEDLPGIIIGTQEWYIVALQHISIGITCAIGVLTIAYSTEKEFQQSLLKLWKGKGKEVKENDLHSKSKIE